MIEPPPPRRQGKIIPPYEYHTEKNPYCWDRDCECHKSADNIGQILKDYDDGLLSAEEVVGYITGGIVL